uniref:Uncharacterized protein n=1 Tax=Rhizophora mucronata TaxID=61149 RepID=A0A2P2IPU0_RHIMU
MPLHCDVKIQFRQGSCTKGGQCPWRSYYLT